MKATQLLHNLGQSIWIDNITRDLLGSGMLERYINELSVTGLTSNPTIFDQAIKNSTAYDVAIREKSRTGESGEALFFELALEDLTRAGRSRNELKKGDVIYAVWNDWSWTDGGQHGAAAPEGGPPLRGLRHVAEGSERLGPGEGGGRQLAFRLREEAR